MNTKQMIKGLLISGVVAVATLTSCKKEFLDINQNPNAPVEVLAKELLPKLLPPAQAAVAHGVGNHGQIYGGLWAQYWTQSPAASQYKDFETYAPSADDFDDLWIIMYADALKDLQTIIDKGTAENMPNYAACAMILKAYTFQFLTDNFGDIPFSEALREEEGILSPRYDSQHDIYHGIIDIATSGLALLDEFSDTQSPAEDDLFFSGDLGLWRKFGNTLLLRMYLRLSYVDQGEAQAGIDTLEAHGAEFLAAGEEVRVNYHASGGNFNPVYSVIVDLGHIQNLVASSTAIDYMNTYGDPRLDAFYIPSSNGVYEGIAQGNYGISVNTPVSLPSPLTGALDDEASETAPVKLMTDYESLFLQAEAVARGWLTGSEQALYEEAISASFASYGIDDSLATVYYSQTGIAYPIAGTLDQRIEAVITQKWVAMNGNQNNEAWIESRRTGFPDFFTISVNSSIGTRFPERFFYPSIEVTRNLNFPSQPFIYNKVWWDVN